MNTVSKKIIFLSLVTLLAAGCSSTNNASPSTQSNQPPAAAAPASNNSGQSSVTISIKNFAFNPSTITVKTGTQVTWVNNDNVAHTVTSDSGNLLNSPILSPGQSYSFTFTSLGSTSYHCKIHTTMKANVIVTN